MDATAQDTTYGQLARLHEASVAVESAVDDLYDRLGGVLREPSVSPASDVPGEVSDLGALINRVEDQELRLRELMSRIVL